jgi:hypothetical protein
MKIPDHFIDSLEKVFGVKILTFFDVDPDPGTLTWIRDGKIRIRDPV